MSPVPRQMPGREEELSLVHEVSLYSAGVRTLAVWLSLFLVHEGRLSEVASSFGLSVF